MSGPRAAEGLALGAVDDLGHVVVEEDDALVAEALVAPDAGPGAAAPRGAAALLARLSATVATAGRLERHSAAAAALLGASPRRARQVLRLVDDPGAWLELLPTLHTLHLRPEAARAGADVGMVRLAPDGAFPHHIHHGGEEVLVLEGSLRDEAGALHGPGVVLVEAPGSAHETVAGPEGAVYLAVVRGLEVPGWEIPELPLELLR